MRASLRWVLTLSLALILHTVSEACRATTVPVDFGGASQAFVGVTSAFGTLTAVGAGQAYNFKSGKVEPFVLTPPNTHLLSLIGGFSLVNSQPDSTGPAAFDVTPTAINDISSFKVDLLNGATAPIEFSEFSLTTNSAIGLLKNISVDIAGTLGGLDFNQTSAATLTPLGPNVGTFSVPGNFVFKMTNYSLTFFGVLPFNQPDLIEIVPSALTGTYTISGPPGSAKITLDGTVGLAIPYKNSNTVFEQINNPLSLTISGELAGLASIFINAGYHLEQDGLVVPEPGSIALMGIGIAMCGAAAWRRRRQSR